MNKGKHYKQDGLLDFYTFDYEEDAIKFKSENRDYNNIYYSWGWKAWIASKKSKLR